MQMYMLPLSNLYNEILNKEVEGWIQKQLAFKVKVVHFETCRLQQLIKESWSK